MLRLLNSVREIVKETPGLNDNQGVVISFRRLNSCLFSMFIALFVKQEQNVLRLVLCLIGVIIGPN